MESGVSENAVSGHVQLVKPGETACFAVRKSSTSSTHVFPCLVRFSRSVCVKQGFRSNIILIAFECYITGPNCHSIYQHSITPTIIINTTQHRYKYNFHYIIQLFLYSNICSVHLHW